LKEALKNAVEKKSKSYDRLDIKLLNWDFAFLDYLIKETFK